MTFNDKIKKLKKIINNIDKKLSKHKKKLKFIRRENNFLDHLYFNLAMQAFSLLSSIGLVMFGITFLSLDANNHEYVIIRNSFFVFLLLPSIFSICIIQRIIHFLIKDRLYYKLDETEKEIEDFFSYLENSNNFNLTNITRYYINNSTNQGVFSELDNIVAFINNDNKENNIDKDYIFHEYIFDSLLEVYFNKLISKDELIKKTNYCIKELNIEDEDLILKIQNRINKATLKESNNIINNNSLLNKKEKHIIF